MRINKLLLGALVLSVASFNLMADKVLSAKGQVSYSQIKTSTIEAKMKDMPQYKFWQKKGFKISNAYKFVNEPYYYVEDAKTGLAFILTEDDKIIIDKKMMINANGELFSKIHEPVDMKGKYQDLVAFSLGKEGTPALYVITDPDCPYCVKFEQKTLDKLAKNNRVHVILTALSFHPDSPAKIEDIMALSEDKRRAEMVRIQGLKNKVWKKHSPKDKTSYGVKLANLYKDVSFSGTPFVTDSTGRKLK